MTTRRYSDDMALLLLIISYVGATEAHVFRIGYISGSRRHKTMSAYERPGFQISGAISLAVDQINRHHPDGLLINHSLEFEYAETFGIEDESIKHTARFSLANISAIIGPQETCLQEARLAAAFNTLMLTYFCPTPSKDGLNHAQYSTFVNVKPPVAQISKSVASLLLKYNWNKITFIYNTNAESGSRRQTAETIRKTLQDHGIQILQSKTWDKEYYVGFENLTDYSVMSSPFVDIVRETKDRTRIYVVVGELDHHVGFLNAMEDAGLLAQGEYFVVGVYLKEYKPQDPAEYLRGVFESTVSQKSVTAFKSFLAVIPTPQGHGINGTFLEFDNLVNEWLAKSPFNFTWTADMPKKRIRVEARYLHDAVFLYARALNECLSNTTECPNPHDGTRLVRYLLDKPYFSAMGYGGYIDANGEAQGNYSLLALKENPKGQTWNVGLADIGIFSLSDNRSNNQLPSLVLKKSEQINWPQNHPPLDEPPCGFDNSKCQTAESEENALIFALGGIALLAMVIFVLVIAIKHWNYEQDLVRVMWKIDWKDLHVPELMSYLKSNMDPDYDLHRSSLNFLSIQADIGFTEIRVNNFNTEMGFYKKQLVAIKRVKKGHIDLTREIKKDLKLMRDLRHDNLCGFIGASVEPVVCIVMEYCQRGSLKDILYDENCALDDIFISSLVADLVRGMCYIHQSQLKSHGSLKPSNLLVDSRFVLKITDYGLHEFKRRTDYLTHHKEDDKFFSRLLWTAPELLRTDYPPPEGTQSGDVYSFAIVLFEIYGRSGPFGNTNLSAREMIAQLRMSNLLTGLFRPPLQTLDNNVADYVVTLITDCWNENPQSRPDFQTIKNCLKPMQSGMKPNIMDNVMSLLQRYATNLETLVGERTVQLQEEKKKTETLLYEILPRPVAEHLIKEEKVEAEQFDCVTIFFSDIVGFTALSADSTPFEVVNFLNDLYTLFDSLLEHYDAYKVETIGDSYMVCSGLPIRNGEQHAGVIASMGLHLLDAIKSFRIRHRPNQPLLLRIGMHSGPVVAGVVGMKMPRYCLFGDTVNTTSRFESTGEAMKIHCSPQSKSILDDLGGYVLEPRGLVHMKGKGDQLTYWLTDEDESIKQQRQLQDFSSITCLNRASPILAKWGSQSHASKRRLSTLRAKPSPAGSPCTSRHKLESESSFGTRDTGTIKEERNGPQGSLPNILKCINDNLENQYDQFQNGDAIKPLLMDQEYIRSETRSANCSRAGSYEMLNITSDQQILVA